MIFKCDDFQACLNQTFLLKTDDYEDELELIQVDRMSQAQAPDGNEAFAVVFQSARPEPIPQRIYHMSNPQMGELELFIVPIGKDETGVRYEAVFS